MLALSCTPKKDQTAKGSADTLLQVAQLHVHITLRSPKDPSWPGPCYGAVPPKKFTPEALEQMLEKLNTALR